MNINPATSNLRRYNPDAFINAQMNHIFNSCISIRSLLFSNLKSKFPVLPCMMDIYIFDEDDKYKKIGKLNIQDLIENVKEPSDDEVKKIYSFIQTKKISIDGEDLTLDDCKTRSMLGNRYRIVYLNSMEYAMSLLNPDVFSVKICGDLIMDDTKEVNKLELLCMLSDQAERNFINKEFDCIEPINNLSIMLLPEDYETTVREKIIKFSHESIKEKIDSSRAWILSLDDKPIGITTLSASSIFPNDVLPENIEPCEFESHVDIQKVIYEKVKKSAKLNVKVPIKFLLNDIYGESADLTLSCIIPLERRYEFDSPEQSDLITSPLVSVNRVIEACELSQDSFTSRQKTKLMQIDPKLGFKLLPLVSYYSQEINATKETLKENCLDKVSGFLNNIDYSKDECFQLLAYNSTTSEERELGVINVKNIACSGGDLSNEQLDLIASYVVGNMCDSSEAFQDLVFTSEAFLEDKFKNLKDLLSSRVVCEIQFNPGVLPDGYGRNHEIELSIFDQIKKNVSNVTQVEIFQTKVINSSLPRELQDTLLGFGLEIGIQKLTKQGSPS